LFDERVLAIVEVVISRMIDEMCWEYVMFVENMCRKVVSERKLPIELHVTISGKHVKVSSEAKNWGARPPSETHELP
jgi:hypothetical protein